ncbi:MAG: RNA polymerase sigma-54 factor, partial [Firmicutes bacterium]|nr:RNA polymerase sigma-54 factor [Bacillota bacterium]
MRMDFGLNLEQTQKLIMTPELRQAITVLQMSSLELTEYVEQQVLENPLLEVRE